MKVIVDTPIWSALLRRPSSEATELLVQELKSLVAAVRVVLLGPTRQEILSGIRNPAQFELTRRQLREFRDFPLETYDYESAAEAFNLCRSHGIQGSHTDFLICAVARRHNFAIFTTDNDFALYARHLPLRLHAQHS